MSRSGLAAVGGSSSGGILLPNAAGAPAWHQALMKVMTGNDATLLCIGDSILSGLFGANIGPGPLIQTIKMLNAALQIPVSDGLAVPTAGGAAGPDNRWTAGAGWSQGSGIFLSDSWGGVPGAGGQTIWTGANGAAGTLTFQPRTGLQNVDTFDLYTIGGGFSVNFNGGADTVVGSVSGLQKTTVSGASTSRPVCNVHAITGALGAFVIGMDARLSTVGTLRVGNASTTSSSTGGDASHAGWTNTAGPGGVNGAQPLQCITFYNPNLCLINLSVNDIAQGLSTAQSIANWTALANTAKACQGGTGGVIFASENPCNPGNFATPTQTAYWAALKGFCAQNGYPLIDIYNGLNGATNGFSVLSAMNPDWYGDGNSIHPGTAGQLDYGRMLAAGLLAL